VLSIADYFSKYVVLAASTYFWTSLILLAFFADSKSASSKIKAPLLLIFTFEANSGHNSINFKASSFVFSRASRHSLVPSFNSVKAFLASI